MSILGLIPARGGSKGIPGKNIKKLAGKELIRYTIETGLQCPKIDALVVSTDDENIAALSRRAGAEVPFLRPPELASDRSPTIDTVVHALRFFEKRQTRFDAVCLLQPTCPFRALSDLEKALEIFESRDADSLISVSEVPHTFNPHWVFEAIPETPFLKIATGESSIIPRRQDLPRAYHRDGSIYITKSRVVLQKNSLYGEKIAFHLTEHPGINIDTPEDWEKAEQWIETGKL